ncbi:hypothetical protein [Aeromonas sp. HZM]|uniref:hypothetical protein n=1 Tax=Aeromonas sp. HZM TaxID=1454008 RepID=UPI00126844E5|nr:hypothetical protein [Aeromonas sp. HZM]
MTLLIALPSLFILRKKMPLGAFYFTSIIILYIVLTIPLSELNNIGFSYALGVIFAVVVGFFSVIVSQCYPKEFYGVIKVLLWINVVVFIFQYVVYHLFGYYVNFHNIVFPFSRDTSDALSWGVVRLGGYQMEPGIYSITIASLVAIHVSQENKFKLIHLFFLSTCALSTSVNGILIFIAGLLFLLFDSRNANIKPILMLLLVIILVVIFVQYSGLFEYIQTRYILREAIQDDSSDGVKILLYNELMNGEFIQLLLGRGAGFVNYSYRPGTLGPVFTILYFYGLVGFCFILACYYNVGARLGKLGLFTLSLVFLTKFDVTTPQLWMTIFILLFYREQRIERYN